MSRIPETIDSPVLLDQLPITPLRFRASDAVPETWQEIKPGFSYRDAEAASMLSATVTVPTDWAGDQVWLHIIIQGGEPLLFVDGEPFQALDYNHHDVVLHEQAQGGETHDLRIEVYAPTVGSEITVWEALLLRIDRDAQSAFYDALAKEQIESLPAPNQNAFQPTVTCIGHSHLDLAYLWAMPNTRKKVGRTWASMLRLMDEYPDFHFTQSQPFLYDVCRQDYPELWERLKARVAEGRWELTGAMWVEPDANIPSGESLIRQALYGQAFYRHEFGTISRVAWLPDTFGFPASFPQILAGCEIHSLLTSKISWNDTNRFPHDTFRWRGSDGVSEVLTYFLTAPQFHAQLKKNVATYNGDATAEQIFVAGDAYRQKQVNPEILHCVGYGDGGGGTTRQMVEMVHRFADAPPMPRCAFGRADEFFDRLHDKENAFPVWHGELYLENHRGTLTSQAWIKRANRLSEVLLRNAELFSVLAEVEAGASYPAEELQSVWQSLLTNQFHDILAGTIVPQAVAEARADFARIEDTANRLLQTALAAIAERVPNKEDSLVVFNPTDTLRSGDPVRVTVPANIVKALEFADATDALLPSQFLSVDKRGNRDYLVLLGEVGALGYQTISAYKSSGPQEESTVLAEISDDIATLENDYVLVTLNTQGEILSFVHKISEDSDDEPDAVREREVIAEGEVGNLLALYDDKPRAYDAWNIDRAAFDTRIDLSELATVERFAVIEEGPVRAGIEVSRRFRGSTITQRIYLYAHSPRLDVQTSADWHEHQTLLCVHFPVAVNADRATYEIAHGYIERPTHENTSWDAARFEVPHHRWMDLSEGDYGVSLLNDCKYGGAVRENDLRLTLIKSGIYPDPEADQGEHTFTYSLLPHTGDFRNETVDEAHALNYPLLPVFAPKSRTRKTPPLPRAYALASVNDQGLVIDAIKRAEEGDGYIVRLYEAFNTRGTATLTLGFDVAEAFRTNLLEENDEAVEVTGEGDIAFAYGPHEILTFRVLPKTPLPEK